VNDEEFDELRTSAVTYGTQHGVDVYLEVDDVEASPVQPGGERVILHVSREMPDGQPPRVWNEAPNYRPEVPDLLERIRRDVRRAAQALWAE